MLHECKKSVYVMRYEKSFKGTEMGTHIGGHGGEPKQVEHEMGSACGLGFTKDLGKSDESGRFLI